MWTVSQSSSARERGQWDGDPSASVEELAGQIEEAFPLLSATDHQAGQDRMNLGTGGCLVAAPQFAGDHRRPNHSLGVIVSGRHQRIVKKHEPLVPMFLQVPGQPGNVRLAAFLGEQNPKVEPVFQFLHPPPIALGRQHLAATSDVHGFLKQTFECLQFRQPATGKRGFEFADPGQHMTHAATFQIRQRIVTGQSVADQNALEVIAQDVQGNSVSSSAADLVNRDLLRTERPQLVRQNADPPTGFVRVYDMFQP